jgi:phosphoglycolate phosphatase-like HAD superfamily hydrolase
MSPVFLFDIDNTLLYTGGAGSAAMNAAFERMFGVPDGFAGIEFSGRTDRFILQGGLDGAGIEGGAEKHIGAFTSLYYDLLPASLEQRDGYLMPGFPELLGALAQAGATLGLATGNFRQAAAIKLDYFGLSGYFAGGGFGDDSLERGDVVRDAVRAAANGAPPEDIVVIGDTPHDVASALSNGVLAVGVATGTYSQHDLRASGAHAVSCDFSDWQAAAAALLSLRA